MNSLILSSQHVLDITAEAVLSAESLLNKTAIVCDGGLQMRVFVFVSSRLCECALVPVFCVLCASELVHQPPLPTLSRVVNHEDRGV